MSARSLRRAARRAFAALVALALTASAAAQTPDVVVDLDDQDPMTHDGSFGIALDADSRFAWIANSGTIYNQSNRLYRADLWTGAIVASTTVGLFPEDVAAVRGAGGAVQRLYVANSSDGTVTSLAPGFQGAVTIPLPGCGASLPSSYPFGALASPDGTRVLVTSLGCGGLFLIDADPTSPTLDTVVAQATLPGGHGRPAWLSYPIAVIPLALSPPSFAWSQAALAVVDVTNPGAAQVWPLLPAPAPGLYDAATDCAVLPDGRVLVTVGFGQSGTLVEIDPLTGTVTRTLDFTVTAGVRLHGLGLNPRGDLAALTFYSVPSDVVFVDVPSFTVVGSYSLGGNVEPNEAVFTADGSRVAVTTQSGSQVHAFRDLPGYLPKLTTSPFAQVGGTWQLVLDDVEHGQPAAVFASTAGMGPLTQNGQTVLLSDPIDWFATLWADLDGGALLDLAVPPAAAPFANTLVFFQAVAIDRQGVLRMSNGAMTQVL